MNTFFQILLNVILLVFVLPLYLCALIIDGVLNLNNTKMIPLTDVEVEECVNAYIEEITDIEGIAPSEKEIESVRNHYRTCVKEVRKY